MSATTTVKGSCLCGSVKLSFTNSENHFHACHCGMCVKWGGGPLFAVDASQGLKFEGEEHIGAFSSSDWAERGFCKNCGTHLFYRLKQGNFCNIPLGVLENPEKFSFHMQIFTDKKLPNYTFTDKTIMMTEAQVFEQFQP